MLEVILAAIPLGIGLSFMVGPVFFVLIETSIARGARAAFALDAGAITADIVFVLIAYYGSKEMLADLNNYPGFYLLGGAVIFTFGIHSYYQKVSPIDFKAVNPKGMRKRDISRLFIKGYLLNILNIGVLLFWVGVMALTGSSFGFDPKVMGVFFGTAFLVLIAMDTIKITLAKEFKKKLTPEKIRLVKRIISVVLMIFGVAIAAKYFVSDESINQLL